MTLPKAEKRRLENRDLRELGFAIALREEHVREPLQHFLHRVSIKAAIIIPTTKVELEKAEAERTRLQQVSDDPLDNVLRVLPDAKARYQRLLDGIGSLSTKHISQAREQVRALVGVIWLKPSPEGYLVATLNGRYEELVKLLHAGKTRLSLVGCGERI